MPNEVMKSDPVKDDINAQSGRFEFFKLTLTLGTASLAGMAALFADPSKIPSEFASRVLAGVCAVLFIVTVYACISGLSTYANLLVERARESRPAAPDAVSRPRLEARDYEKSMVNHARGAFISLFLTGAALLVFTGLRVFYHGTVSPDAALGVAWQLVKNEMGREDQSIQLEYLGLEDGNFVIRFGTSSGQRTYVVRVNKTGQIQEIVEKNAKLKTPDSNKP